MRPGDIRQLNLDHIKWRRQQIMLEQSKTRKPLHLPLLQDVSDALIDYLRNGRPQTDFRNIFIRHRAPTSRFARPTICLGLFKAHCAERDLQEEAVEKGFTSFVTRWQHECSLQGVRSRRLAMSWGTSPRTRRSYTPRLMCRISGPSLYPSGTYFNENHNVYITTCA